jgi:hypothetical protein
VKNDNSFLLVAVVAIVAVVSMMCLTMQSEMGEIRITKAPVVVTYNSSEDMVGDAKSIGYAGCIKNCLGHTEKDAYNICSYGCLDTWMSQQ